MTASSDLDAAFEAKRAEVLAKYAKGGSDDAVLKLSSDSPAPAAAADGTLLPDGTVVSADQAQRNMWLAHRWPEHYADRCVHVRGHWICRRCSLLYPIGTLIAILFAAGVELWPRSWDMTAIWILCIPATVAYCGEALGLFPYRARWQTIAMGISAIGFGRGLGYEFLERWSGEFWWPVTVFGGTWFAATMVAAYRSRAPSL